MLQKENKKDLEIYTDKWNQRQIYKSDFIWLHCLVMHMHSLKLVKTFP